MKIVHLSTYDKKGGAALSAYRLHCGLMNTGLDSSMLVRHRSSRDPNVREFVPLMDLLSRWERWSRRRSIARNAQPYALSRPSGFELFSEDQTPYKRSILGQVPACDVINLHWVATYLDYEQFFDMAIQRAAVVWTLHDMNAVTGGCHYDMGCGRFAQRCGACPQLGSQDPHDLAGQVWDRKRSIFDRLDPRKFCIVTPSRWLGQIVKQSPIFGRFRVETIPYGLDLHDFAPRDQAAARDVLGIPVDAKVVLFLAEMVDNRRKGFALLVEALRQCAGSIDRLWLLSVGNNAPKLEGGIEGSHLNYLGNDRFLSLVYSAADVFVIPSLQDNLPNTVLEAMACGVPVVGFDVGGVCDMVRHGVTGQLVRAGDVEGLRFAIVDLLRDTGRRRAMGARSRVIASEEYSLALQARRYRALYENIIG